MSIQERFFRKHTTKEKIDTIHRAQKKYTSESYDNETISRAKKGVKASYLKVGKVNIDNVQDQYDNIKNQGIDRGLGIEYPMLTVIDINWGKDMDSAIALALRYSKNGNVAVKFDGLYIYIEQENSLCYQNSIIMRKIKTNLLFRKENAKQFNEISDILEELININRIANHKALVDEELDISEQETKRQLMLRLKKLYQDFVTLVLKNYINTEDVEEIDTISEVLQSIDVLNNYKSARLDQLAIIDKQFYYLREYFLDIVSSYNFEKAKSHLQFSRLQGVRRELAYLKEKIIFENPNKENYKKIQKYIVRDMDLDEIVDELNQRYKTASEEERKHLEELVANITDKSKQKDRKSKKRIKENNL